MVYKSGQIFLPFCHNSRVWQTDGRTEFSSQYRVCITCSAVKRKGEERKGEGKGASSMTSCAHPTFVPRICHNYIWIWAALIIAAVLLRLNNVHVCHKTFTFAAVLFNGPSRSARQRSGRPWNVYHRFGRRLNLTFSAISPLILQGIRNAKFGLDFRHRSPLSRPHLETKTCK